MNNRLTCTELTKAYGKKTVLDYILKPVMKARQNALTER